MDNLGELDFITFNSTESINGIHDGLPNRSRKSVSLESNLHLPLAVWKMVIETTLFQKPPYTIEEELIPPPTINPAIVGLPRSDPSLTTGSSYPLDLSKKFRSCNDQPDPALI